MSGVYIVITLVRSRTAFLLSSGLLPSVPDFHRFNPKKRESRTVTAGRESHPAPKNCHIRRKSKYYSTKNNIKESISGKKYNFGLRNSKKLNHYVRKISRLFKD